MNEVLKFFSCVLVLKIIVNLHNHQPNIYLTLLQSARFPQDIYLCMKYVLEMFYRVDCGFGTNILCLISISVAICYNVFS